MSREQSQSARERRGKRSRALSRRWEPTAHVCVCVWGGGIIISGDLSNPSTEESFVSSLRRAPIRLPYAVGALPGRALIATQHSNAAQLSGALYNSGESSHHDNLLFNPPENTFRSGAHLETISSSCVKGRGVFTSSISHEWNEASVRISAGLSAPSLLTSLPLLTGTFVFRGLGNLTSLRSISEVA